MKRYNWIMYCFTPTPGDASVNLRRVSSIKQAKEELASFEYHSGFADECTAALYSYSDEAWAEAEEYATIGCPFEYPSIVIDRGVRGGMKAKNA